ncbi:hypothetical protein GVAV_003393 [Gurleya vavrai]
MYKKSKDGRCQDKILFIRFPIIPFNKQFRRLQCKKIYLKIQTSRENPTRPLDSRKKYDHKEFEKFIARNFIESDSNTETNPLFDFKLGDESPIPSQNAKIQDHIKVNGQKLYLSKTKKRKITGEYDSKKNKKMALLSIFTKKPKKKPITQILLQTNDSSSQQSNRHGLELKPNLYNHEQQNYNVQDLSNSEKFVQPLYSDQKNIRIDEIHKKLFEIDIQFTKEIITKIDMFFDHQDSLHSSYLETIFFLDYVEQKTLIQYYERNPNTKVKVSKCEIDTKFIFSRDELLNNHNRVFKNLANDLKNIKKLEPVENSQDEKFFCNILFNPISKICSYSNLRHKNFFKSNLVHYDLISFNPGNIELGSFLKSLGIENGIDIVKIEKINTLTNSLIDKKIFNFDLFLKIIVVHEDCLNIDKIEFFLLMKKNLCGFIEENKIKIQKILPSCILFEKYTNLYETGINKNSVSVTIYIYFLYLFRQILGFDWDNYIGTTLNKLNHEYDEYFNLRSSRTNFSLFLKEKRMELSLDYFFILRIKLEINKIFLILIKPFLSDKTIEKYASMVYLENIECFKSHNRLSFDSNQNNKIVPFQGNIFILSAMFFTASNFHFDTKNPFKAYKPHKESKNLRYKLNKIEDINYETETKSHNELNNDKSKKNICFSQFFTTQNLIKKVALLKFLATNDLNYAYGLLGCFDYYFKEINMLDSCDAILESKENWYKDIDKFLKEKNCQTRNIIKEKLFKDGLDIILSINSIKKSD